MDQPAGNRVAGWIGGALIGLLVIAMAAAGAALLIGGALLVAAGGSAYYVVAGLALAAAAFGLARRSGWTIPLYALLLLGTLLWALWEAGLDGWALVPRLVAPTVLALVLLIPAIRRRAGSARAAWLAVPIVAVVAVFGLSAARSGYTGDTLAGAQSVAMTDPINGEWRNWGRTLSGERFSPIGQITTANVAKLERAWTFTSDIAPFAFHSFEATPVAADGRLYLCLDRNVIVALDQDSGKQLWRFDPHTKLDGVFAANCRGVTYFEAPQGTADCPTRILFGAQDNRLMAVDARTGRPCSAFGRNGAVDLMEGLGPDAKSNVFPTSPPTVANGVAMISGWVTDGLKIGEPSGVIRGYDAVTGALRWAWDSGRPDPQRPLGAGETYTKGAPNAWGVFSADPALGLAFIPTGVSTPDYFGAHRSPEAERYATSIVALDLATGRPRWSFQTVHHDLWDYDIGAQPVLTEIRRGNARIPALVAPTKRGQFFVLDRRTGRPIYPVSERPVPQNPAPGERTSRTQPYSSFAHVAGERFTERDMWGATPFDQLWCRLTFKKARYEGDFTPPSLQTAIYYPGSAGGVNWGSVTIDPGRRLMITNSLYMADIGRLVPRAEVERMRYSEGNQADAFGFPQEGTPYAMKRTVFLNPLGVPCQQPPFGRISAIDIDTGKLRWSKPLGTAYHAGPMGLSSYLPIRMGVPNLGGSLATAGGVAFIGAAQDRVLRAFDIGNGKELWHAALPHIAAATPMTYVSPRTGRQYVVIASGGHPGLPGPAGGTLVAYALPRGR